MAKKYKCRVEYLESTGTQYIDTGVSGNNPNLKIEVDAKSYEFGWCYQNNRNGAWVDAFSFPNDNLERVNYGNYTLVKDFEYDRATRKRRTFDFKTGFYIDGVLKQSFVITNYSSLTPSLPIFARYDFNSSSYTILENSSYTIYGTKIYDDNTLVRDFIPVLDNNGRPAMYDQVSGQLFYNQGTGEFSYGRQIIPVEYLESTGTQYIDTGYTLNNNSVIEISAQSTDASQLNNTLLGVGTSSSSADRVQVHFGSNAGTLSMRLDGTLSSNQSIGTNKFISKIDIPNKKAYFNNTEIVSNYTGSIDTTDNVALFNRMVSGNVVESAFAAKAKVYYLKIRENNALVRDFIPCIDENHVPFMFDKVSNTVYLNAGTGQFKFGPNIEKIWGGKKLRRKLALALANLKKKRKYYCEVEYLESTGTQYVDTGVTGNLNTSYEIRANTNVANNTPHILFGARTSYNERNIATHFITETDKIMQDFGNGNGHRWTTSGCVANRDYICYNSVSSRYTIDTVTGTKSEGTGTQTTEFTTPSTLWLFNGYGMPSTTTGFDGKVYYCKIWDNGNLVRDFIPVLDWDMTPCMYDRVTEQLFYNQGTGSFTYGRQIHPVEYLESTGTQYINTGYKPNTNTECSMDFMVNTLDSTYRCLISVRTSDGAADSFTLSGASTTQNVYAFGYRSYWDGAGGCPMPIVGTKYNGTLKSGVATFDNITGNAGTTITPSNLTAYMFARNANGTAANFFIGRIYDCQLKDNGTLVRDFIPAIDSEGRGFMFDRVTHTIYDNAGQGQFSYPAREVEYLESSGTQRIDTGYSPSNTTGVYAKIQYVDTTKADYVAVGTWLSNNRFVAPFRGSNQSGKWFSGWGASEPSGGNAIDTNVHEIYLNYKNDRNISVDSSPFSTNISTISGNWKPLFIFSRNLDGTPSGDMIGKIYNVKLTEETEIVRDFIPAYKDGALGMWDKVNSVFYPNAGTGTFTTSKIVEPEYE